MKSTTKHILLSLVLVLISASSFSQFDTLNAVFKPRIGLGTGTMAYFGEIQGYQSGFSSTINRMGGNLMVNAPLNKAFNFEFVATYGKISANERSLTRNYNFQSRIRMGSLNLQYNFYPLFHPTRSFFNPYIGIGITSFEFLSKTDLYAANGSAYYYWSDGSIMDLAENDPNAKDALPLIRDYKYETDLRTQDYDSLGKYREQSFAIPLSFGAEFHITPRVDFRIGTTLNLAFTDLIDNISPAGSGIRKGDDRNDFILYSNIGLSYDLEFFKESKLGDENSESQEDLLAYDQTDWDKDGVIDAIDNCYATPVEALVDEHGCPLDTDKDGVADYIDEESTPLGNHVNRFGVTISEEIFLRWQELMMDSTGLAYGFEEVFSRKDYTAKRPLLASAKGPENRSYVVIIGKEHKSVSANELHKFLGYTEFETVLKGDTIYYVLGKYEKIEDAVAAKSSLENEGIAVEVIGKSNNAQTDYLTINDKVIEKIEKINIAQGKPLPEFGSTKPNFRVQIGSFKKPVNTDIAFPGVDNITFAKGKDGLIRYYSGVYDSHREAKSMVRQLKNKGIEGIFIVAYQNKKRITLKEAKVLSLPKGYDENNELNSFVEPRDSVAPIPNKPKINPEDVKYQVLLGSFTDEVPIDIIEKYLSIGGIQPIKTKEGITNYYSRKVNTLSEAENLVNNYHSYELNETVIMVLYKGIFYTLEAFDKKKR